MPDGWHEPGGPVFGPDGLMYFGQGTVGLNGIIGPAGFTVDIAIPVGFEKFKRHRMLQEITLELVPHAVLYRMKV